MKQAVLIVAFIFLVATLSTAIPKPTEASQEKAHKDRKIDKVLSDKLHFKEGHNAEDEEDDEEEEDDEHHNSEYDHEAFLGKEEAQEFDQLSPEESQHRLGLIYDKIDKDGDGQVTEEELRNWIKYVQNRYIQEDADRQWSEYELTEDSVLKWETYQERTYGYSEGQEEEEEEGSYNYKDMIIRDKRRWEQADLDKDGKLSKEEFSNFLHPEEADHMKSIVVTETLEDIDTDKDGFISLEEYIADMWPDTEEEEEPEWVKTEREQFKTYRDKNGDGKMDTTEVQDWILPSDYDHSEAESKHLIHESDEDKDGKLSKEEVVKKYDLFVGSQATDFGEALSRHDEF